MYTQRPYKHTITEVSEAGGTRLVVLGTYSTREAAIRAAQRADRLSPDETREVRLRDGTYVNRYHDGPCETWR